MKIVKMTIRISEDEYKKLSKQAKKKLVPMNLIVREFINKYL